MAAAGHLSWGRRLATVEAELARGGLVVNAWPSPPHRDKLVDGDKALELEAN